MGFSAIGEQLVANIIRRVPHGLYSELVGWCARCAMPRPVRAPLYRAFAKLVGIELDEVELPLSEYASFGAFFARRLRKEARPVTGKSEPEPVFPCDGAIAAVGRVQQGVLIQAKGHTYQLADLLADDALARRYEGGSYATIYLSPRDYHRVHAPAATTLLGYDFVPGMLFPVNAGFAAAQPHLFTRNERLVLHLRSAVMGDMALVMVGALGVGNMVLVATGAKPLQTRMFRGSHTVRRVQYSSPVSLDRGAELGCFELGSTVIIVFERERVDVYGMCVGDVVTMGAPLVGREAKTTDEQRARGILTPSGPGDIAV